MWHHRDISFPGFPPEQPPPYYPSTAQMLPFYLWSPPSCTLPVPSCPHDSPHLGTIGVDYALMDNRRDSEVSSIHTSVFDRDVRSALEAMSLNNPSGSPVLSNPIASYRPGLAAAPYRDPASVPGALSPDWISRLTANNADWYGGGCGLSPSFLAQSYVASSYLDDLKRKPFSYRSASPSPSGTIL